MQVFDNIRATNAKQLLKIRTIKGDVSVDGLDMNDSDRLELIDKISIVFHCAANVRFDQPIKDAVNMNTLGTSRMLKLAEQMTQLKVIIVLVHQPLFIYKKQEKNPDILLKMDKYLRWFRKGLSE